MEQDNKKKMFLRKEKSAIAAIKQKKFENKSQKANPSITQKTSFKSTLEKLHRRNMRTQMDSELKNKVRKDLYKNHKLSKTISKVLGI